MGEIGFKPLVDKKYQSPIITSFIYPKEGFEFQQLYNELKRYGFVIYPGKISKVDTFRIGNIGDVHEEDINRLVDCIAKGACYWVKVFCLGGAGKICREAILDLVQFSSFETITVADFNEEEGRKVVEWLNDPRVDFVKVDVTNHEDTVAK